jgi:RNA-directed DNA polymerase
MKKLVELSNEEAKKHFLKGSSYFNGDLPSYISFEPILTEVEAVLKGGNYPAFMSKKPNDYSGVNYNFVANKDGRLAWRPYELIHPAIYVSLVNMLCDPENWSLITKRLSGFDGGAVECCSAPVMSLDDQKDVAKQVRSWWQCVEQRSLICSLEFSHVLHTDVIDCYGSLYTHSISWALHGIEKAKKSKGKNCLIGNKIDSHIQACRYGQTNGISQGSVLMDFVAEIVLGYVDDQINAALGDPTDFRILRSD